MRTAVAIANVDFSKAFNIVSCKTLIEKLMKDEPNKQAVRWTEDCPKSQAQKAVISGTQSANSGVYPRGQDWVWSSSTPPLMVWMMGHSVPSAHLQSAERKHFKQKVVKDSR